MPIAADARPAPAVRTPRNTRVAVALRFASLQVGLFLFGVGIPLTLQAHLGLSPWDVFHQGISRHSPLTLGEANEAVGLLLVAVAWLLGIRPGVGTVCNMVLVGFWVDRVLGWHWIPDESHGSPWVRAAMLAISLVLFGVGSGAYIAPRFGAGPRDAIMLALASRTHRPVAVVRGFLEASACVVGFLLGGTVGIGTVVVALLLGPAVQAGLRLFGFKVGSTDPAVVAHPDAAPPAA